MAITRAQNQVKWAAANSLSVGAGLNANSDLITFDPSATAASITLKVVNGGTPAAGDTVDFYLRYSSGDPDADPDVAIEHASADSAHAEFLGRIDVGVVGTNLRDAGIRAVPQNAILYVESNAASAVTVSAIIEEQRAA